jgi:hypothetical protein
MAIRGSAAWECQATAILTGRPGMSASGARRRTSSLPPTGLQKGDRLHRNQLGGFTGPTDGLDSSRGVRSHLFSRTKRNPM